MRCMTLAGAVEKSHEIIFLCSKETLDSVPALKDRGYQISHEITVEHADWLVVDHYGLDKTYENASRTWAKRIMVIDDLADREHDCDVLIDQTYGRNAEDYKELVPSHCEILVGTDFALLKPEFAKLRSQTFRDFDQPKNILVSFGGVNPKNATEFALEMLQGFERALHIDVVTGAHAENLADIKTISNEMNEGKHSVELFVNTSEMPALMAKADLCIGAGGTTSWERCCLKLPSITLELADNQTYVLKQLDDAGVIKNLGRIENLEQSKFLEEFSTLIASSSALKHMQENASFVCDGKGAERVKCYLLSPDITKDEAVVTLRPMLQQHCKILFNWQQIPEIRKFARSPESPKWEEHQEWYKATLHNADRHLYMIDYDGKPAGMLRLDRVSDNIYEVSILIDPQYHGLGLASSALRLARKLLPDAFFKAEVLEGNDASHKLFQKAGYEAIDNTWYQQTAVES